MKVKKLFLIIIVLILNVNAFATDDWRIFGIGLNGIDTTKSSSDPPPFCKWHKINISYTIVSEPLGLGYLIDESFDTWESCGYLSFSSVINDGDITVKLVDGPKLWIARGPITANRNGEITNAMIKLNDGPVLASTGYKTIVWTDGYENVHDEVDSLTWHVDLQNCVTHEIGHALGIAHHSTGYGEPTMATRTQCPDFNTTLKRRTLETDDWAALHFLYKNAFLPIEYDSISPAVSMINQVGDGNVKVESGSYTLSDNILLSSDINLHFKENTEVFLNSFDMVATDGSIYKDSDATIHQDAVFVHKLLDRYKGFYTSSSIDNAFSDASGTSYTLQVQPGTHVISVDHTITNGMAVNINPYTTLQIADGKKLTVNGTLNAAYTTFTASNSSWKGIQFGEGSDGDLYNCDILHVGNSAGVYIYNASPDIEDCAIDDDEGLYYGIRVYGSNAAPTIRDNTVMADYAVGAQISHYAEGTFTGNLVHLTSHYPTVCNVTHDAYVNGGSNTFSGGYLLLNANHSTLYTNGSVWCNPYGYYHISASNYSYVYANSSWWSPHPPEVQTYLSDVSTSGSSSTSCSGIPKPVLASTTGASAGTEATATSGETPLDQGWQALHTGDPQEAGRIFTSIVDTSKNNVVMHQALRGLAHTFTKTRDGAIMETVTQLANQAGPLQTAAQQTVVHCYEVLRDKETALQTATTLYEKFPESDEAYYAKQAALTLLWELGRDTEAQTLKASFTPKDEYDAADLAIMESLLTGKETAVPALSKNQDTEAMTASWDGNIVVVPNPYDRSKAAADPVWALQFVNLPPYAQITVYNVAGRIVRTGSSSADFRELAVPDGVYLYRVEELDGPNGVPTGKQATGKFVVVE